MSAIAFIVRPVKPSVGFISVFSAIVTFLLNLVRIWVQEDGTWSGWD
jgi:hypothetical protein